MASAVVEKCFCAVLGTKTAAARQRALLPGESVRFLHEWSTLLTSAMQTQHAYTHTNNIQAPETPAGEV